MKLNEYFKLRIGSRVMYDDQECIVKGKVVYPCPNSSFKNYCVSIRLPTFSRITVNYKSVERIQKDNTHERKRQP